MGRLFFVCVFLGLSLSACSVDKTYTGTELPPWPVAESLPAPEEIFVVLPARYSRHLDGQGRLMFASSGVQEDLPVYANKSEAVAALRSLESRSGHLRHMWRVYRVQAAWSRDVAVLESGGCRLKNPAPILGVANCEDAAPGAVPQ